MRKNKRDKPRTREEQDRQIKSTLSVLKSRVDEEETNLKKERLNPTPVNPVFDLSIIPLFHEIANQEPLMAETVERLVRSMSLHGFRDDRPITMYDGKILDGRTRHIAAEYLGIPTKTVEFRGTVEEAQEESDNLNIDRRDPSKAQKAMICAYAVVDYREQIALAKSELRQKYPKDTPKQFKTKWAKVVAGNRFVPKVTVEYVAKKRNVSKDYVNKCIKYLTYPEVDFQLMCQNIFDGKLEIYQAEEKYQVARQAVLSANRVARQLTEEESLLYEKIDLAKAHPEVAAREIIHLMMKVETAEDIKDKLSEVLAENIVLSETLEAVSGDVDTEEHY